MADFRRWFFALAMLVLVLGSVAPASAQSNVQCSVAPAVVPNLRQEGFTELTGDILLTCTPSTPGRPLTTGTAPQTSLSVSYSAPITSRILSGAWTDALLLIDDPTPVNQTVCPVNEACLVNNDGGMTYNQPGKYNVFQAAKTTVPSVNSITFYDVPVDPPATSRTYRITNVRVDATGVPGGVAFLSPVYAFVSSGSPSSFIVENQANGNYVGYVSQSLIATVSGTQPAFLQCQSYENTIVGSVTFTENFVTAFKTQGAYLGEESEFPQDTPGSVYYTESGLEIAVTGGEAGYADAGTQFQTTISNIPSGVVISIDAASGDGETTWASMVSPFVADAAEVVAITDGSEGSVTVVWEVFADNPQATDTFSFNIYAAFTGSPGTPGSPTPNEEATAWASYNPTFSIYQPTGPIPEFSSSKDVNPNPTNLFSVSLCQTILLFPYVTDYYGFDTGIAISNTSADPLGSLGASPQAGACSVNFYGNGGAATTIGTDGVYSSTTAASPINGTGLIQPGQTWAFSLSQPDVDAGYGSTSTYGTTGYAIAICDFQYAHGYSFVSDLGIRNFAAAYLALIIPDAPRVPQPFTCTANGGKCTNQTGEQLVH